MKRNQKFKSAVSRAFGTRLKHIRTSRGINVKTLSRAAQVTMNSIYEWERGEHVPTIDALYQVRHALNCSWGDLLGD